MEKTNKTSKKSKSSLIALLVAILLCVAIVLGMGGITLAKYVESKEVGTTSATVAKWGYTITADSSKLFGDAYNSNGVVADYSASSLAVKAESSGSNIVAPGATGEVTFSVVGKAEVLSAITFKMDDSATTVQLKSGDTVVYEPIKWTLYEGTKSEDSNDISYTPVTDATDKKYSEIITKLNDLSVASVEPNSEEQALYYKLGWAWEFENSDSDAANTNNGYDTILGEAVRSGSSTSVTVDDTTYTVSTTLTFNLTITVEQIQKASSDNSGSGD